MPRQKPYEKKIPSFYRKSAIDIMMFAHVNAIMNNTNMAIKDAIYDFMDMYGISIDDFPIDSALVTYNRIKINFLWKETREKN